MASAYDVLRFVDLDVERKSAWGAGKHASRQIEINGQLLGAILSSGSGRGIDQSTPLVKDREGAVTRASYLVGLLGGPKSDPLPATRIALGYCDACLDFSCGVLLGATLGIDEGSVRWSSLGFDHEPEVPAAKLAPFWRKAEELPESGPWESSPFEPEMSFRFDRNEYLRVIQDERRRVAAL